MEDSMRQYIDARNFDILNAMFPGQRQLLDGIKEFLSYSFHTTEFYGFDWGKRWYQNLSEDSVRLLKELANTEDYTYTSTLLSDCIFLFDGSYPDAKRAILGYRSILKNQSFEYSTHRNAFMRLLGLTTKIHQDMVRIEEIEEICSESITRGEMLDCINVIDQVYNVSLVSKGWVLQKLSELDFENVEETVLDRCVALLKDVTASDKMPVLERIVARYISIVRCISNEGFQNLKRKEILIRRAMGLLPQGDSLRKDLGIQLVDVQKKIPSCIQHMSTQIDVSSFFKKADQWLADILPIEKLAVIMIKLLPYLMEENYAKQIRKSCGLSALFPPCGIDENGRIMYQLPALLGEEMSDGERKKAIHVHAINRAATEAEMYGQITWDLLRVYNLTSLVNEEEIRKWLENNNFVDIDRMGVFVKGLVAGFKGDLMQALYLLVPQVENSVRGLALVCNEPVKKDLGDHEEYNTMDTVISGSRFRECIDPDVVFTLEVVFVSHYGINARNEIAHGTKPDSWFKTREALFVWLIILKLCLTFSPYMMEHYSKAAGKINEKNRELL